MAESKQHWLDRNRPPRVQITYDVETGNAIEKKEIPFVVGVMSDLGDNPGAPRPKQVKDRKFVEIDRDNFNDILASTKPEIKLSVADEIKGSGKLPLTLTFTHIDDFRPERLVERIDELRKLLTARQRLNDLLGKLEGNDELSAALKEIVESTEALQKIQAAVSTDNQTG